MYNEVFQRAYFLKCTNKYNRSYPLYVQRNDQSLHTVVLFKLKENIYSDMCYILNTYFITDLQHISSKSINLGKIHVSALLSFLSPSA